MNALKPEIRPLKNITGRKITGYEARLGNIVVGGHSKEQAVADCLAAAMTALQHDGAITVMHDLYPDENGIRATWILEYRNGWGYRIARPMRPGSHFDGHSACGLGSQVKDRRDAEDAMRRHWYQNNVEPFVQMLIALGSLAG